MRIVRVLGIASTLVGLLTTAASAQIKIGAIISITGPTAALGVGYKSAFATFPAEIGGKSVTYIIRDDAADASQAVTIAQRMIEEDHVDAIIGPTLTSSDYAVQPIANAAKVPMIATAPIDYDPGKNPYTFSAVQPVSLMINAVIADMAKRGVKTVAYIGYSDGFGDQVYDATKVGADKAGIEVVANERYARTDTSAESQVLKAMTKKPDAVMIGGSGTPGTLPDVALHRRGYKGLIYGNHGDGQSSVPASWRPVGGRHDRGDRTGCGVRPIAGEQPIPRAIRNLHEGSDRQGWSRLGQPLRRLQRGRLPAASGRRPHRPEDRPARAPRRVPASPCATRWKRPTIWLARMASIRCRRPITTAWTTAPASWCKPSAASGNCFRSRGRNDRPSTSLQETKCLHCHREQRSDTTISPNRVAPLLAMTTGTRAR